MKHLRHPAMFIAALALFVALGGGAAAYASGLISGSRIENHSIPAKKLTKSALKSLRGKRGPAGPRGATGATGVAGATGNKGATGATGPSNAYTFYRDAGVSIASTSTTVATANLAAGDYAIFAKTYLDSTPILNSVGYTTCTLTAEGDIDQSSMNLGGSAQQMSRGPLSMQVSHEFAADGTAVVACFTATPLSSTTVTANWTKITAIKVGSVTSRAVTG